MPTHIVRMPRGFIVLRVLQIFFAVTVLGLSAYLISQTSGGVFSAEAFTISIAIATLIITAYKIMAETAVHGTYHMWAILASDIVGFLFWIASASSLGALRATFTVQVVITTCTYGIDPDTDECISYKRGLNHPFKRYAWAGDVYLDILNADTAMASMQTLLFLIGLVIYSIRLSRRRSSLPRNSSPTRDFNNPTSINGSNTPEKLEMGAIVPSNMPSDQSSSVVPSVYGTPQPAPALNYNEQPPPQESAAQSQSEQIHSDPIMAEQQQQPPYQPSVGPAPSYPGGLGSLQVQFNVPSSVRPNQVESEDAVEMP